MEHVAAIMMLVACAPGNTDCRELPASSVAFETVEECRQLLQPSVYAMRHVKGNVYGECTQVDPALFIEDATISWAITPAGKLDVDVTFDEPAVPLIVAGKEDAARDLSN